MKIKTAEQYAVRYKKRGQKVRVGRREKWSNAHNELQQSCDPFLNPKYDGTKRLADINQCFQPTALKPKTFVKWSER